MNNQGNTNRGLETGSKKSSTSPKVRLVGQLSLLFVAIGLVSLVVCAFTVEDFEFFDTLRMFFFVCMVPAFAYLYTVIDSAKQKMTEDQQKAHLLAMAKQDNAQAKQYKIMMSGVICVLGAFSGLNILINAKNSSAFINGLLTTVVFGFVAVTFIASSIKSLREFRQILDEEAAGKLEYLKQGNAEQSDYVCDEAFDNQSRQVNSATSTSLNGSNSENNLREPKTYDNIQL